MRTCDGGRGVHASSSGGARGSGSSGLKIKSLNAELFADFESEPYFEGFPTSSHAESFPSKEECIRVWQWNADK